MIHWNIKKSIEKNCQKEINPQKRGIQKAVFTPPVEHSMYNPVEQGTVPTFNSFLPSQNSLEINHIPNNPFDILSDVLSAFYNSESSLEKFKEHLRWWAIGHHIAQTALSDLLKIIKSD